MSRFNKNNKHFYIELIFSLKFYITTYYLIILNIKILNNNILLLYIDIHTYIHYQYYIVNYHLLWLYIIYFFINLKFEIFFKIFFMMYIKYINFSKTLKHTLTYVSLNVLLSVIY